MRRRLAYWTAIAALAAVALWSFPHATRDGQAAGDRLGSTGGALRLWIMDNGPAPIADMQRTLAPFTRETGIKVDVELVPWGVQFDRIRAAAVSGQGPDVTQAGTTQVPYFAALGGFADLRSLAGDVGGSAAYSRATWKTTQRIGSTGTWAIPWFTEARAIYYRRDILLAAGVDPDTAFTSWQSFRTALERIRAYEQRTGGQVAPFALPGRRAYDLVHAMMPFIWSAGGRELSANGRHSTIDSAPALRAVEFVGDLVRDHLASATAIDGDNAQVEADFKAGRVAVWISGPWVLASRGRDDDDAWTKAARRNVAVARLPAGPNGTSTTFVGGSNLMVFEASRHREEASKLVHFLASDRAQIAYANVMGMLPARRSAQRAAAQGDPDRLAFLQAAAHGRSYATIAQWAQIENVYKDRLGDILELAARRPHAYSHAAVARLLGTAAREADSLLAGHGS